MNIKTVLTLALVAIAFSLANCATKREKVCIGKKCCLAPSPSTKSIIDKIGFSANLAAENTKATLSANITKQEKVVRLKKEIPGLAELEAVNFELCMLKARGDMNPQLYSQWVNEFRKISYPRRSFFCCKCRYLRHTTREFGNHILRDTSPNSSSVETPGNHEACRIKCTETKGPGRNLDTYWEKPVSHCP